MSFFEPPSTDPTYLSRSGDEVEGLLRQFYQSEMPDPWPPFRWPEEKQPPAAPPRWRGWILFRSRLALAASVSLLVAGHVILAHSSPADDAARDAVTSGRHEDVAKIPSDTRHRGSTLPPGQLSDSQTRPMGRSGK
jgi:hypothetical protein